MPVSAKGPLPFRSVLIFGGAGFIGSNWAQRLLDTTDANIHIFDNLARQGVRQNLNELQSAASSRLKVTIGDIRNAELVRKAVHGATEVFHFAAQVAVTTSVEDPRTDFEVNVSGTLNILEAARTSHRRPFLLFTSTNKVYGHLARTASGVTSLEGVSEDQPLDFHSPYGCSKGAADQYVHDYARIFGVPSVVLRMSCIAGPRQFGTEDQGWVAHFLYSALQDTAISIYGDGRQVRDVLGVQDLMRAFEAIRDHREKSAGQVYNIGGGPANAISLLDLVDLVSRMTGKTLRYNFEPSRPGDQPVYVTDFSKFESHTGWRPHMSVHDTLEQIQRWWSTHQEFFVPTRVPCNLPVADLQGAPEVAS